jgi:hypothetical protein
MRTARRSQPVRALVELLEPRSLLATLAVLPVNTAGAGMTEGQIFLGAIAQAVDSDATVIASQLQVTINWGDGTPVDTTTGRASALSGTGANAFSITGSHTYNEEAGSTVPPFAYNITVTVKDTKNNVTTSNLTQGFVMDAGLSPGNPSTALPSQHFFGGGGGQPSAATALANFETAIGGPNNGGTPSPQNGGFRTINWDGVKLDGTDFGGGANTTVINFNTTVGIPLNRFQTRGVFFGAVYAVSGDGFKTVNPGVNGLFPPFSTPSTFAMFNDNGIDFKFIAPSANNTTLANASSRGFGAIFINVELPNTTSIQYFNGNTLLDTEYAPVGGKGLPVFVGALFNNPVVTRVSLTLGTDVIFNFNGSSFSPGPNADDPAMGHNLVVTDDWAYAEPVPTPNGLPIISGSQATKNSAPVFTTTQGQSFTGIVATFSDSDPNGNAKDFTATINWGDGHLTNGAILANGAGGFDVSGTNTYSKPGVFPVNVDIADFGGSTVSVANTGQVLLHVVPDDYDGQGQSDFAVFRATQSLWLSNLPSGLTLFSAFGQPNYADIPVPGDYDGLGHTELAVFRPSTGQWIINSPGGVRTVQFGMTNLADIPVPADYDGVGHTELAVFRPSTGQWLINSPSGGRVVSFGATNLTDIPVPGDYDGLGHAELAVFRPSTGQWFINSPGGGRVVQFGATNFFDIPAPGDYDGTGKVEVAVFRPSVAQWLILSPSGGRIVPFGAPNYVDVPLETSIASLVALHIVGPGSAAAHSAAVGTPAAHGRATAAVLTDPAGQTLANILVPFDPSATNAPAAKEMSPSWSGRRKLLSPELWASA